MQINNTQLIPAFRVLNRIKSSKMRPDLKQVVFVNFRRIRDEVEDFEQARLDTIKEYAETDENGEIVEEDGQPVFYSPESRENAQADLELLLERAIDIQIETVELSILLSCEDVTVEDADVLDFMIADVE